MLELPESYTYARQMREQLEGKVVSCVELLKSPHRFAFIHGTNNVHGAEEDERLRLGERLEGQCVTDAVSHGGMVELDFEEDKIVFSDGAYPKYFEEERKAPKKHQCAIHFDDGTGIYVTIAMYGGIHILQKDEYGDLYYLSSSTKPDPLSKEFTFEYFQRLFADMKGKKSAKAFLATEQRIPGLGNGVLQDILWDAGIDPRCVVTEEMLEPLYQSVCKLLRKMVKEGGRDTEKDLFGKKGGYITQLSKNSLYEPCMRCGCEIHKANYMGGTIYFCEHCQKRDKR